MKSESLGLRPGHQHLRSPQDAFTVWMTGDGGSQALGPDLLGLDLGFPPHCGLLSSNGEASEVRVLGSGYAYKVHRRERTSRDF